MMPKLVVDAGPHARAHLYAIVRVDGLDAAADGPWESRITVKEVVLDADHAAAEVRRLNDLNRDKDCYYFWTITRLKGYAVEGPAVSPQAVTPAVGPERAEV